MTELKAEAAIPFPNLDAYYEGILASLAAHSLVLHPESGGYRVTSSFGGVGHVLPGKGELLLKAEAADPAAFNRIKHAMTSLIDFVARDEALEITWIGDETGAALPPDLHILTVGEVSDITPQMRRVIFTAAGLEPFDVPDQLHCRLLFPQKGTVEPEWPRLGDNGRIVWPDAGVLATRIYTIRQIDPAAGRLVVDFYMHEGDGPGTAWARTAMPGDIVGILGPAAHGPKPADWYLLIGDETGLPGIARILEDLPDTATGHALIEVSDRVEEQDLAAPSGIEIRWLHRNGAAPGTARLLPDAVRAIDIPENFDKIFIWIGAEYAIFRDLRGYLRKDLGIPAARMVTYSHWRRGMSEDDIAEAGATAVT